MSDLDLSEVAERFWAKVDVPDGPNQCWEWTASSNGPEGYGAFRFGSERLAHRAAWRLTKGPIPNGLCVLHRCDNPPCVRPDHLFLGDRATNNRDRRAKGRSATGDRHGFRLNPDAAPKGEANARTRLTPDQVRGIRLSLEAGERPSDIATRYEVDPSTIRAIKTGRTWAWME